MNTLTRIIVGCLLAAVICLSLLNGMNEIAIRMLKSDVANLKNTVEFLNSERMEGNYVRVNWTTVGPSICRGQIQASKDGENWANISAPINCELPK